MCMFRFFIINFFSVILPLHFLVASEEIVSEVIESKVELENVDSEPVLDERDEPKVLGEEAEELQVLELEDLKTEVLVEEFPESEVLEFEKNESEIIVNQEPIQSEIENQEVGAEVVPEIAKQEEPSEGLEVELADIQAQIPEEQIEVVKGEVVVKKENEPIFATVEGRVSYFWPESKLFRDLYHNGGISYALEGIVPVYQGDLFALRGLNFWWGVDYFYRSGKSKTLDTPTKIQMEMITAGLKYMYPAFFIRPYFGVGCKYYFLQVHTHSNYMKHHINRNGVGAAAEIGLQTLLSRYVTLDLFCAYSFKQFGSKSVHLENVRSTYFDVSGLNAGAGIGIKF